MPELLTVAEAAQSPIFPRPVAPLTVRRMLKRGLRSRLIAGRRWIDPADLETFIEAESRPTGGPAVRDGESGVSR